MDRRRVTLTPGTTLRFGSLGFIYTRPVEPVAGRTFTWLPRSQCPHGGCGTRGLRPRLLGRRHRRHVGAKLNTGAF
jgi:hypothetical protein